MICKELNNCKTKLEKTKDTFKDNKGCRSKYLIENKSKQSYYRIDFENSVYKNNEKDTKCDYGIITNNAIVFIELKGSNVRKGIKQLLATANDVSNCTIDGFVPEQDNLNIQVLLKKARLIVSKYNAPKLKTSSEYVSLAKLTKQDLIIKQNIYTEVI